MMSNIIKLFYFVLNFLFSLNNKTRIIIISSVVFIFTSFFIYKYYNFKSKIKNEVVQKIIEKKIYEDTIKIKNELKKQDDIINTINSNNLQKTRIEEEIDKKQKEIIQKTEDKSIEEFEQEINNLINFYNSKEGKK